MQYCYPIIILIYRMSCYQKPQAGLPGAYKVSKDYTRFIS